MKKILIFTALFAFSLYGEDVKNLNNITVTAQKTDESVQDVPIAMSVFSDTSIEDKKIDDLADLSMYVPNFYILNLGDFGVFQPTMRGISAYKQGLNKSVGLYIDGAIKYGGIGYDTILDDIERVEVLRGPQGTLYGGNSLAGVVNIVTKKPTNKTEGRVSLELGEDNKRKAGFSVRTPIIKDKLFIGLSGNYYEKDGFMKSATTGKTTDDRKNYFGKVYLRATPTDRLELSLISTLYKSDNGGFRSNAINTENPRIYNGDLDESIDNTYYSHTLSIKYEFDNFNLSSATTYSKDRLKNAADNDKSVKKLYHSFGDTPIENLSQELKLDGQYKNLKWLVGTFVGKTKKNYTWTVDSIMPTLARNNRQDVKEKHFGIFTHLNYALNDKLNLIGGIRFDKDESQMKDYTRNFDGKDSYKNISPKIALEYKINNDFMTYATIAKGYIMGGFFPYAPVGLNSYDSESLYNYELGFKSSFLENKINLNADIFYTDISDMQVESYLNETSTFVSNAAKAKIYGLEIDANYALNRNFLFFANFGLTEAKFDEYKDFKGDYSKNYIQEVPKINYSLGATFRGFGGFYTSANLKGYGKTYTNKENSSRSKAFTLVDAKIGYEWENFDVYIYANNLFDKNYDQIGYFGQALLLNPGREVGLKFTYRF